MITFWLGFLIAVNVALLLWNGITLIAYASKKKECDELKKLIEEYSDNARKRSDSIIDRWDAERKGKR